jgi:hypothetical protein
VTRTRSQRFCVLLASADSGGLSSADLPRLHHLEHLQSFFHVWPPCKNPRISKSANQQICDLLIWDLLIPHYST